MPVSQKKNPVPLPQYHCHSTTATVPAPLVPHGTSASFVVSITDRFGVLDASIRFRVFELHEHNNEFIVYVFMIPLIQP